MNEGIILHETNKQTNKQMQNVTKQNAIVTATDNAIVIFPPALMEQGVTLAKAAMKSQLKIALLWADAILQGVDGVELIKACFVAAGYAARDARGTTTNASKFVAPARMVRNGDMSEKAFFALKTADAAAAFKEAGGMKGDGLDPAAWQAAREDIASREAVEKVGGEGRPPEGNKPSLSAFQILSAAISLRKSELNVEEIDRLVMLLRA
jgi:hypothetical protein